MSARVSEREGVHYMYNVACITCTCRAVHLSHRLHHLHLSRCSLVASLALVALFTCRAVGKKITLTQHRPSIYTLSSESRHLSLSLSHPALSLSPRSLSLTPLSLSHPAHSPSCNHQNNINPLSLSLCSLSPPFLQLPESIVSCFSTQVARVI